MDFYLGLTGLPGTGKEAVSRLITEELAAHGIRTLHYTLSGPISLELKRRGLPPDREQFRTVANEVRANLGNGAWATRTAREAHEVLATSDWTDVFVMIDGVRNPAESAIFKQLWGSRFHLLAVDAPEDVRRRNLTARSSPKDAAVLSHLANASADSAAIAPVLTAEMGIGQPQHGTNVVACIELADWTLVNAEHDPAMRALRAEVRGFVEGRILPMFHRRAGSAVGDHRRPAAVPAARMLDAPRVLIVESDPAWQERLAALLEEEGCTVEIAASYAAASQALLAHPSRQPYQLITVDLHLTSGETAAETAHDSGGFGLLQSLYYFDCTLPSIVVSDHVTADQVSRAFRDLGVRDCYPKASFAGGAFQACIRRLLQTQYFAVAAVESGADEYLVVDRPCTLSVRIQRDAPVHHPLLGGVCALQRPCGSADWPTEVTVTSPDLALELRPGANQQLAVPANFLAEPLIYDLTPLTSGNGQLALEFHAPGRYVSRLTINVAVRNP